MYTMVDEELVFGFWCGVEMLMEGGSGRYVGRVGDLGLGWCSRIE